MKHTKNGIVIIICLMQRMLNPVNIESYLYNFYINNLINFLISYAYLLPINYLAVCILLPKHD